MHKTGHFGPTCKRWRKKSSTDKTWVNLKTHFKAADRYQFPNATAKDGGYARSTNSDHINQSKDANKQQVNKWATAATISYTDLALVSLT